MNRIEIKLVGQNWYARFTGKKGEEVRRLMGAEWIVTPWLSAVPDWVVSAELEARNPGFEVVLLQGDKPQATKKYLRDETLLDWEDTAKGYEAV